MDPGQLDLAWSQQYSRLSQKFSRILPKNGILAEIGYGRGQLTIPLSETVPRLRIVGVDNFRGSYSETQAELLSALAGRSRKVKVVLSDYQTWFESQPVSKYDALVSSEFLPELDSESMRRFFGDCYRVIKRGGKTIHSFLSPAPRNARQRRLIEADSDPRWTKTPPAEWFSPNPKLVSEQLVLAGFKRPHITRLKNGLIIRSIAARELLRDWDIRQSYWKSHQRVLEKEGLEAPDWIMIDAIKPTS